MKVVITSKNPVKKHATLHGFTRCFPEQEIVVAELSVPSGVSDQPMSEEETLRGAITRVENGMKQTKDADYWIGIEGGIEEKNKQTECFAWVYIRSQDGKEGKGRTGTFFLPQRIISLVKAGKELGEADDIVFKQQNSKQKLGTVGMLTGNIINRTDYYVPAVVFALIPFMNPELY